VPDYMHIRGTFSGVGVVCRYTYGVEQCCIVWGGQKGRGGDREKKERKQRAAERRSFWPICLGPCTLYLHYFFPLFLSLQGL